tara:strand:+ start:266 stop:607 length:342 start_codon:yes stop_codon:yes gene_type:complete
MNAIRGAIATVKNNKEDIIESSKILFSEIIEKNSLNPKKIVSIVFTTTHDLTEAFPAKAVRDLGYEYISVIDTLAPNISSDLEGCIRILVTYQEDINVNHVYLNEAKNLRPDR